MWGCVQRETGFRTGGYAWSVRGGVALFGAALANQYAAVMTWLRSAGSSNSIRMRPSKLVRSRFRSMTFHVAGHRLGRVRDQGFLVEGESGGLHRAAALVRMRQDVHQVDAAQEVLQQFAEPFGGQFSPDADRLEADGGGLTVW